MILVGVFLSNQCLKITHMLIIHQIFALKLHELQISDIIYMWVFELPTGFSNCVAPLD
jgi:hypothetical protein